jgi:GNAT superfamily N-acetyltransferase
LRTNGPSLDAEATDLAAVEAMREEYRREMACQIVHDSWHRRGFSTLFSLRVEGAAVGYAAVGGPPGEPRDVLKEFYLMPAQRMHEHGLARRVLDVGGARFIEAQTNDLQLSSVLWDWAVDCTSEVVLFADGGDRALATPGATVRPLEAAERSTVFLHEREPVGDVALETDGNVVATGGFYTHYNPPYADLFLEVAAQVRGRGYGGYLVQELRRRARAAGYVPVARCHVSNAASRGALLRGGMAVCGRIVRGRVRSNDACG